MSRDFIGSKISIITKSQIRYSGTIIGIDAQTSSIILGNVKSFGTENRSGHSTNGHTAGTVLPIMQFANSDIEDLKIVDEEQTSGTSQQQQPISVGSSRPGPPPSSSTQQPSIHDDPAIVSAVVSSTNKDNNTSNASISSRLIHNLQQMSLADGQSKNEQSRIRSNSGELGPSWSLLSPSKWEQNNSKTSTQQDSGNKSKFFDDFISDKNNNTNQHQFNRSHQRSSNTHSTQTSRQNGSGGDGGSGNQYDENGFTIRQPFFSNDRPYPQRQQQQQQQPPQQQQQQYQQNRYQNGNGQNQQRYFHNNNRRPQMLNQQRRTGGGGGNRETFQDNPNDYDADFDFETSNLKFNKLTSEDELKNPIDLTIQPKFDQPESSSDYSVLYDKKKSFFDNLALKEPSDGPASHMYNRSKNTDTFGNEGGYQRYNNRSNGGYGQRRPNNNYRQQQYGNDDFHYRQHNNNNNNNGYHYRY